MKRNLLIALALIVVLFLAGWTLQASKQQWEYKFIQVKLDFKKTDITMNELGAEGWEAYALNENGGIVNIYFKRPK